MGKIIVSESELRQLIRESVVEVLNEETAGGNRKRPKKPVTRQAKKAEALRKAQYTANRIANAVSGAANKVVGELDQQGRKAVPSIKKSLHDLGYYAGRTVKTVKDGYDSGRGKQVNEDWDGVKEKAKKVYDQAKDVVKRGWDAHKEKLDNETEAINNGVNKVKDKVKDGANWLRRTARKAVKTWGDAAKQAEEAANKNRTSDKVMTRIGQGMMDTGQIGPGGFYPNTY